VGIWIYGATQQVLEYEHAGQDRLFAADELAKVFLMVDVPATA
jgi:hypothetical protein